LHTLQNKISEPTKSQLQDTYEACPKEVLDEETFGYENEHYGNNQLFIIYSIIDFNVPLIDRLSSNNL